MKRNVRFPVQASLIAALYATLTIMQNILLPGSASAAVQFRVSEVLAVLALYTPAAIPGLFLGCIIANISSLAVLGPFDMIFGSAASLLAALCMYALRNVRFLKLPILALLMPALFNGVIVGFEIEFFFVKIGFLDFLIQGGLVAVGELAVLFVLGIPLVKVIEINHLDKKYLNLSDKTLRILYSYLELFQRFQIIFAELDVGIDDVDMVFQTENDDGIARIPRVQRRVAALFEELLRFVNRERQSEAQHHHLVAGDVFRRFAADDLITIAAVHSRPLDYLCLCQSLARHEKINQLAQAAEKNLAVVLVEVFVHARLAPENFHQIICTLFHFSSSLSLIL